MPRESRTGAPSQNETTCDSCGLIFAIGEWAWCPHGTPHWAVDYIDYVDDNIGPDPIHFTSRRERRRYMDANGIDFKDKLRDVHKGGSGGRLFFDMARKS